MWCKEMQWKTERPKRQTALMTAHGQSKIWLRYMDDTFGGRAQLETPKWPVSDDPVHCGDRTEAPVALL